MSATSARSKADVAERVGRAVGDPYRGYAYAYPHKSAYRPLEPPRALGDVWRETARGETDVYVHIPFCEMRCGFCNLFTAANMGVEVVDLYVEALKRDVDATADATGRLGAASLTVGGGTPTYLSAPQLARIVDLVTGRFGLDLALASSSVETSPGTATADRLDVLAERGISRISIGVQSFIEAETKALGRPQDTRELTRALDLIRARPFKTLNIDLMYGSGVQTPESWCRSLEAALTWAPEEIFLYPLYVRPLTGLDGRAQTFDAHRLALYRVGRDLLRARGYTQLSMRMFCKGAVPAGSVSGEAGAIHHSVVGLGCGARSRTRALHYSGRYAVGRAAVTGIIQEYCQRAQDDFAYARFGVALDRSEQMRRAVMLEVLSAAGLDLAGFATRYRCSPFGVVDELEPLMGLGLLEERDGRLVPTESGLEVADAIGPLLTSAHMETRMATFEPA
jgi:oxygen-independent coproporphyrinogen III oxidase